jgi:hypothetical protein
VTQPRRRAIALGVAWAWAAPAAAARLVPVATPAELRAALAAALPGDAIEYDGGECDSATALALLVPPAPGPPAGVGNALRAVGAVVAAGGR